MQLVTRLLLRLVAVGSIMLLVALSVTLVAARQDVGREAAASQEIGQLIKTLGELQNSTAVSGQVQAINALNQSDALRHLHVALIDQSGRRLTEPDNASESRLLPWLNQLLTREVSLRAYSLAVLQPNGERLTVLLEPNPYSESAEVLYNAMLFLSLYAALAVALIAAMWISVKLAFAPLADILSALSRFEAGDFSARLARYATRELNLIAQALNHLAAALTEQIAKQRELMQRLQEVQEDERRKLAHELHDEFGQLLTAMQVDASYVLRKSVGQPGLEACARAMCDNSSSILSQLKGLLVQLRPYGLQGGEERDIALEQALRDLVRHRQSRRDDTLDCRLSVSLGSVTVAQRLAVAVYRIAQEALTNVMRHAQASCVDISVHIDHVSNTLCLRIVDDGIGFDPLQVAAARGGAGGLGIAGMRERVLANQGSLRLTALSPRGMAVDAVFPLMLPSLPDLTPALQ